MLYLRYRIWEKLGEFRIMEKSRNAGENMIFQEKNNST